VPLLWLFMPQFIAIGVLFFWLIRVHFTHWYDGETFNDPVGEIPLDLKRTVSAD